MREHLEEDEDGNRFCQFFPSVHARNFQMLQEAFQNGVEKNGMWYCEVHKRFQEYVHERSEEDPQISIFYYEPCLTCVKRPPCRANKLVISELRHDGHTTSSISHLSSRDSHTSSQAVPNSRKEVGGRKSYSAAVTSRKEPKDSASLVETAVKTRDGRKWSIDAAQARDLGNSRTDRHIRRPAASLKAAKKRGAGEVRTPSPSYR